MPPYPCLARMDLHYYYDQDHLSAQRFIKHQDPRWDWDWGDFENRVWGLGLKAFTLSIVLGVALCVRCALCALRIIDVCDWSRHCHNTLTLRPNALFYLRPCRAP